MKPYPFDTTSNIPDQMVGSSSPATGCAHWWSEGWQRLMDVSSREYDSRALPYRGRTDHIYDRTMGAHERDGRNS